jgi:hypothetical protein
MIQHPKIYVAGHRGVVGSAIVHRLLVILPFLRVGKSRTYATMVSRCFGVNPSKASLSLQKHHHRGRALDRVDRHGRDHQRRQSDPLTKSSVHLHPSGRRASLGQPRQHSTRNHRGVVG